MDHKELFAYQDDCLIAIETGKSVPKKALQALPPWRAVLIARVALRAGCITKEEVDELVEEAKAVGGSGLLSIDEIHI